MKKIKQYIWRIIYYLLGSMSPKTLVSVHYKRSFGHSLDWNNPKDINEKINWLKFYGDTSLWHFYADKYRVREYIKQCGLEDMLVPLYGMWTDANQIEWDLLPNRFVMKTNHGSGDVLICRDKSQLDVAYWTSYFSKLLKTKYGSNMGEPHYNKIHPCIIAEQLLDNAKQQIKSSSIVDYKVWTFDGKPEYIWVCYNRTKHSCDVAVYDLDWNFHPEFSVSKPHYVLTNEKLQRPQSLDKILDASSKVSKGFPELRADFYEVNGKPYFGEMTFSAAAGFNDFYTPEFLRILGEKTQINI